MNAPLPYSVEYAKSSRSTCKRCRKLIAANSLRMSKNQPATFFDGSIDSWFHYACFWMELNRGKDLINISSIRGVDWLKWEDQENLRRRIQVFKEPYRPASRNSPEVVKINTFHFSTLRTEKSASCRGKCSSCGTFFKKGEIKSFLKSKAMHLKCLLLGSFDEVDGGLEDIPGWMDYEEEWRKYTIAETSEVLEQLREKKRKKIKEKEEKEAESKTVEAPAEVKKSESPESEEIVIVEAAQISHKRPASEELEVIAEDTKPTETAFERKRRLVKEARMAELKKKKEEDQANQLWEHRNRFDSMNPPDRLKILKFNDQDIPEGQDVTSAVIERLADNALFGCPIGCPECPNGKIVYDSSRRTYVCTGYATEYSKCRFENKNPVRTPFRVPENMIKKYGMSEVVFNEMCERMYREDEADEVVVTNKRKSKGGHSGSQFIYAAEAFDGANIVPVKLNQIGGSSTHIIKNGTVVDAKFAFASRCHVLKNEEDGSLFQATLSFTDLSVNKNSYYKIQLLKDDMREDYYVFRSWGRVGTDVGNSNYERFDREGAIDQFNKVFFEKTKNEWIYRKHFKKWPGSFNYVETDYSEFAAMEQDIIPGSKTLLPKSVKEVVMSIFDIENMKSALKSFEMDINKMPLGRLSQNQIRLAFTVLTEISDLLLDSPVDHAKILDASNKFYTFIPHNFGMKVPEPIDTFHKIKEKNNMLNALLEIKFAYDQICGGDPNTVNLGLDPVDVNYQKMKCALSPLSRESQDWNLIEEYLINSRGSTHQLKVDLLDILQVNRDSESSKFQSSLGNRRLLWHGSGKMNFAGILSQGLRIAPPEAPVSGYMFGKGVYFADMFSKSFFYCRVLNAGDEAYLLLCDVALGVMHELIHATTVSKKSLPKGTHSVKGIGREYPDESGNFQHSDGYMVPKGVRSTSGRKDLSLIYNEYIVYDVDQVQLKYLVRVKVHSACRL